MTTRQMSGWILKVRLSDGRLLEFAEPVSSFPVSTTDHGGRGVYFDDPDGHHFEALTARYDGSVLT